MVSIGIREFRNRASELLRRVQAGETLLVTDRGVPIAEVRPVVVTQPPESLLPLIDAGKLIWRGGGHFVPVPIKMRPGDGGKTSTDYIREQRR